MSLMKRVADHRASPSGRTRRGRCRRRRRWACPPASRRGDHREASRRWRSTSHLPSEHRRPAWDCGEQRAATCRPTPRRTVSTRIQTSQKTPKAIAANGEPSQARSTLHVLAAHGAWQPGARRKPRPARAHLQVSAALRQALMVRAPSARLQPHQQHLGERQDDERDHEQHEREIEQRGPVHALAGFGEFVGEHRGDAVGRREQRDLVELALVADDEGDGHRLAERADPLAQHHAAHDAGLGERQHDLVDDLPGRRAQAVGGLLQHRRHDFEHIAHHRGDERNDHDRQDDPGAENAHAHRRAARPALPSPGTLPNALCSGCCT